jgi:hypothetical protein
VTQKPAKAGPPLLLEMNYAKAIFDFGWLLTPLVGFWQQQKHVKKTQQKALKLLARACTLLVQLC